MVKSLRLLIVVVLLGAVFPSLFVAPPSAEAATIIVTPTAMDGWVIVDDNGNGGGSVALVDGPATPPMGTGSLNFTLSASNAGWMAAKADYLGTYLSDITALSYSSYRASGGSVLAVALQFNIDYDLTDGNTGWQGRLVYEPYRTETVLDNTWQTWSPLNGLWWGSSGAYTACIQSSPCTWAQVLAAHPNAGVHATLGAVLFKAGSGWASFDGNVDGFHIATSGGIDDTYDFEFTTPVLPVTGIDVPHNGMIMITADHPVVAYDSPAGEQIRLLSGTPLVLPQDYDGNGFDTHLIVETETIDNDVWYGIFIGSDQWAYVRADEVILLYD